MEKLSSVSLHRWAQQRSVPVMFCWSRVSSLWFVRARPSTYGPSTSQAGTRKDTGDHPIFLDPTFVKSPFFLICRSPPLGQTMRRSWQMPSMLSSLTAVILTSPATSRRTSSACSKTTLAADTRWQQITWKIFRMRGLAAAQNTNFMIKEKVSGVPNTTVTQFTDYFEKEFMQLRHHRPSHHRPPVDKQKHQIRQSRPQDGHALEIYTTDGSHYY